MAIPDGGLITETNRQYYAGAQQFLVANTAADQTFTSTFNVDLTFGSSDSANNSYLLNNFKLFFSADALTWTEFSTSFPALTAVVENATGAPSTTVDLTTFNNSIQVGDLVSGTGVTTGTKVATLSASTVVSGTIEVPVISVAVNLPTQTGIVFNYTTFNAAITVNNFILKGGNIPVFTNDSTVRWLVGANVVNGALGTLTRSGTGNTPTQPGIEFSAGQALIANPVPTATQSITLTLNANILAGMGVSGSITNAFGTGIITLASGITVRSNTTVAGKSVLVLETGAGAPGTGTIYTWASSPWNGDTLSFSSQELTLDRNATVVNGTTLSFSNPNPFTMVNNVVTVNTVLSASSYVKIQMNEDAMEENNGAYSYTRLTDVIDNFLVAYVGAGKLIPSVKRSDVIFHARRGLQEFSYDTLKSVRSQELSVNNALSVIIPQDYVNYVRLSWTDGLGVQHTIYPANTLSTNPYENPAQDDLGIPTQDSQDSNITTESLTEQRFDALNPRNISGAVYGEFSDAANINNADWFSPALGQRYGMTPETSQQNGWFLINDREGKFQFTSNLSGRLIVLEYISDGNAYDLDSRIPKLAEDALYAHITHAILSASSGIQEYIVRRFKQERSAKLRNAKIRLSNIKLDEIVQVMRGKSKWIKY